MKNLRTLLDPLKFVRKKYKTTSKATIDKKRKITVKRGLQNVFTTNMLKIGLPRKRRRMFPSRTPHSKPNHTRKVRVAYKTASCAGCAGRQQETRYTRLGSARFVVERVRDPNHFPFEVVCLKKTTRTDVLENFQA